MSIFESWIEEWSSRKTASPGLTTTASLSDPAENSWNTSKTGSMATQKQPLDTNIIVISFSALCPEGLVVLRLRMVYNVLLCSVRFSGECCWDNESALQMSVLLICTEPWRSLNPLNMYEWLGDNMYYVAECTSVPYSRMKACVVAAFALWQSDSNDWSAWGMPDNLRVLDVLFQHHFG